MYLYAQSAAYSSRVSFDCLIGPPALTKSIALVRNSSGVRLSSCAKELRAFATTRSLLPLNVSRYITPLAH